MDGWLVASFYYYYYNTYYYTYLKQLSRPPQLVGWLGWVGLGRVGWFSEAQVSI